MFNLTKRRVIRACIAIVLSAVFGLAETASIFAHAKIVRVLPIDGSTVANPPREIELFFTEPIVPDFSSIKLIDSAGRTVPVSPLKIDANDRRHVTAQIAGSAPLASGLYNLSWVVLAADGHYTRDYSVFGVGDAKPGAGAGAQPQADAPPAPVEIALRIITYGSLALITGGVSALFWLLRGNTGAAASRRAWSITAISIVVFIVVGIAWLFWQVNVLTSSVAGAANPADLVFQLLGQTQWGVIWLAREAIAVCLLVILLANKSLRRGFLAAAFGLTVGLCIAQGAIGHAAGISPDTVLAIGSSSAHIFAAGLWIGALAIMVAVTPVMQSQQSTQPGEAAKSWSAFSNQALIGAGLIGATGLYNTARQVQTIDALVGTLYGQALLVKLLCVILVAGLGFVNSLRLHPTSALSKFFLGPRNRTFKSVHSSRAIVIESLLSILIFTSTSIVTSAAPAHGPEFAAPPANTSPTQIAQDMLIGFSVKPNLPGQNLFVVDATSTRRPEPAPVGRIILRIQSKESDLGVVTVDAAKIDKTRFQAGGTYMSLSGRWQVDVIVRRPGLEDVVSTFDWIMPSASLRPVVISNTAWEPDLTLLSMLFAVIVAALLAVRFVWSVRQPRSV